MNLRSKFIRKVKPTKYYFHSWDGTELCFDGRLDGNLKRAWIIKLISPYKLSTNEKNYVNFIQLGSGRKLNQDFNDTIRRYG